MVRQEYEELVIAAGHNIHLLGCLDDAVGHPCAHVTSIWSGECLEAAAALDVIFDRLGLKVPPETEHDPTLTGFHLE